jgi:LysR family transcriptional regulator, low CO2-responsive transcriptional regulator
VHLSARQLSPTCQSFRRFVLENTEMYLAGEYADLPTYPVRIRHGG